MAVSPEGKARKLRTITAAVIAVVSRYPDGYRYHGNELKEDCVRLCPEEKDSYVESFLRMMRRHCRHSYRVVDQNNSLYEKIGPMAMPVPMPLPQPIRLGAARQMELFPHVFFGFFFIVLLGGFFASGFGFGRPLIPPSFMDSKSASAYIPAEPIYLNGSLPFLLRRIFTAADEIPIRCAISNTVMPSIHPLYRKKHTNQVENAEMLHHCNINVKGNGGTVSLKGSTGAKGDLYEEGMQKFSGMA